jgi:hypothetical protein
MHQDQIHLTLRRLAGSLAIAAVAGIGIAAVKWLHKNEFFRIDKEVLSYGDVITYFVEERPADERIRSGALLKEQQANTLVLTFVFLDESGSICTRPDGTKYGQRLRVRKLDEEMLEVFAAKDLVVFE